MRMTEVLQSRCKPGSSRHEPSKVYDEGMSAFGNQSDIEEPAADVRFPADCVAKLFLRSKRAIMIQKRMQARNIDSMRRSVGFDYCAIALQQRVLQQNRVLEADIAPLV